MDGSGIAIDPHLPRTDIIALENLIEDIREARAAVANDDAPGATGPGSALTADGAGETTTAARSGSPNGSGLGLLAGDDLEAVASGRATPHAGNAATDRRSSPSSKKQLPTSDGVVLDKDARHKLAQEALESLSDPKHPNFEPTVFVSVDLKDLKLPAFVDRYLLRPYIGVAQKVVRYKTDVVMLTHLLIYFTTTIPSALWLFWSFTWTHAVLHFLMQLFYMPTYTLMMHQHIHQRGILAKGWPGLIDYAFPFVLDPLMGHTWNSYYYHHVKHHHVEGNGPGDLSSTIYFQRDNPWHFAQYVGRFYFFVWLDLPLYFYRTRKYKLAARCAFSELGSYAAMYCLWRFVNARAAFMVVILPFLLLRLAFMAGNWGQHAFVDWEDADSDYRSSITLIDVPSNRYCFNDGYHTSHHLNPMRHWRQHPVSFIKEKETYARERALVFHGLDFNMITIKCLQKDYMYLAQKLVPMGDQIHMTMEERAEMLRQHTRQFTKEDMARKFRTPSS
ncbi:hypothetical protein RB594_003190 [Gaeumannomyces avenae]